MTEITDENEGTKIIRHTGKVDAETNTIRVKCHFESKVIDIEFAKRKPIKQSLTEFQYENIFFDKSAFSKFMRPD